MRAFASSGIAIDEDEGEQAADQAVEHHGLTEGEAQHIPWSSPRSSGWRATD